MNKVKAGLGLHTLGASWAADSVSASIYPIASGMPSFGRWVFVIDILMSAYVLGLGLYWDKVEIFLNRSIEHILVSPIRYVALQTKEWDIVSFLLYCFQPVV